jgi:hypothetical protein
MPEKSPWLTIWIQPRATIRQIVAHNPKRSLWLLAAIYGFSSLLNSFQSVSLGSSLGVIPLFLIALIFSPIWGYIVFAVWSWVISWTGRWLKGQADFQMVRAAYAWSCVPLAVNGLLWIAMILIFGLPLFIHFPEGYQLTDGQASLLFLILIGKVVLAIWSLVIYLNALAEVQQFSVLRAIGNVIIAGLIIGVVFAILWTLSLSAAGAAIGKSQAGLQIFQDGKILDALRSRL